LGEGTNNCGEKGDDTQKKASVHFWLGSFAFIFLLSLSAFAEG
jgi:hypothetical protein